jgi:hypothetical protein
LIETTVLEANVPTLNQTIYTQEAIDTEFGLPETEKQAEEVIKKKTICIALALKKMGTRRKVSSSTDAIETDTDRNLLLINKIIIDSAELEAIHVLDGKIRAEVKKKALPADMPLRGCYLLPTAVVSALDESLVKSKAERDTLVDAYVAAYPTRIAEAESRLGKLFNPMDYLEVEKVKGAFLMEWTYPEPIKVSGNLKEISNHLFKREIEKMGEKCQDMLQQVEGGLIDYMQEFIDRIIDSLSIKDDGKPKVFKSSTVKNFVDFLEQLPQMNISNNQKLTELGIKAKKIMEGADAQILRKDLTVRQALQDKLHALKMTDLAPVIEAKPDRKVSFE